MAFPTTSVLDNFTGTNGTDLPVYSANWQATPTGGSALEIQDNAATGTSAGGNNSNSWVTDYGPDCEVYVTINTKPADGNVILLFARGLQTTSLLTVDGYVLRFVQNAGTDTFVIQRITNGAATSLSSTFNQEVTNGDSIGLEIVGNTLTAYYKSGGGAWTSLGSTTDSTYTGAGKLGILTSSTGVRLDDFGGGTYAGVTDYPLDAQDGAYSVTGSNATLAASRLFNAETGSYSVTGANATLAVGKLINAESGSYSVSGVNANLIVDRTISSDAGSYSITGANAQLLVDRALNAEPGSYSVNGIDATLTYTPSTGAFELNAESGNYSITGVSVTFEAPTVQVSRQESAGSPPQRQKQRPVVVIRDDEEQAQVTIKQIKRLVARRIGKAPIKQEVERQAVELAQIFPIDLTEATELIDNITQQEIIANMRKRQNQDDEQAIKLLLGLE
jgi:hypothetical protein